MTLQDFIAVKVVTQQSLGAWRMYVETLYNRNCFSSYQTAEGKKYWQGTKDQRLHNKK